MRKPDSVSVSPVHIRYVIGYGLTSVWATLLLFSSRFSQADSTAVVTMSMLSGVLACVSVLAFRQVFPRYCGRTLFTAACAVGMAAGTLLCTLPMFEGYPVANVAGITLSGLCAMPMLLAWFTEYAGLHGRAVVFLAGCALLFAAVMCFALSNLSQLVAACVMGASPLVIYVALPEKATASDNQDSGFSNPLPGLLGVMSQAVSARTLMGIVVVFFVMGSLGVASPRVDLFRSDLSPALLLYPAAVAAFFVGSAFLVRKRIDASILYKVLLVALAGLLFALVFLGRAGISYIFYTYIMCDVLLWTVLVLASKQTPVQPFAVFITGWLAECLGNVVGHNVAALMADTTVFAAVTGMLIVVAIGFAFSEGALMLDLEEDDAPDEEGEGEADTTLASDAASERSSSGGIPFAKSSDASSASDGEEAATQGADTSDPISEFVAYHGLSKREAEVFVLWVTGHGLKYIQENLFISESTAKTHMRNIYRKCGVHNRAEIIDLYENSLS